MELIHRYLAAVDEAVNLLRRSFGARNLLADVESRRRPRTGSLAGGGTYSFHGVGCLVVARGVSVDFDFGPDGRADGFDAWRLFQYAEQLPDKGGFRDLKAVEAALRRLEEEGLVTNPRLSPSPHLFYLSTAPGMPATVR